MKVIYICTFFKYLVATSSEKKTESPKSRSGTTCSVTYQVQEILLQNLPKELLLWNLPSSRPVAPEPTKFKNCYFETYLVQELLLRNLPSSRTVAPEAQSVGCELIQWDR